MPEPEPEYLVTRLAIRWEPRQSGHGAGNLRTLTTLTTFSRYLDIYKYLYPNQNHKTYMMKVRNNCQYPGQVMFMIKS